MGRVFAGRSRQTSTFHITEAALEAWQAAGLSLAEAAQRTVLIATSSSLLHREQELAEMRSRRDTHPTNSSREPIRTIPAESKALPAILTTSADERFRLGLQIMLSGI